MALQSITNISIDFYDQKYILINAKQYDKKTRFLSVTCYNHGELFHVDYRDHAAYIRYKKADGHSVFNFCEITKDGKILVELTEQMLAASGICYADFVLVNRGQAEVDAETGEIVNIDRASVLSTMTFCIDVSDTAVENSEIESTYEFNLLNKKLEEYWTNFEEVIRAAKSYAIGNAGGFRQNEDSDNAKYYYEQILDDAEEVSDIAANVENMKESIDKTASDVSKNAAIALAEANNAGRFKDVAEAAMEEAKKSAKSAEEFSIISQNSATSASDSAIDAKESASSAETSESNALNYLEQTRAVKDSLSGAFLPMGTITFAELSTLIESGGVEAGYLYNISDAFTTDDTFKVGANIEYDAGTNVYYGADGYWHCLAGMTVTGVKGEKETVYRKGNVDITAENVGAVSSADVATVDEVKEFLNI